MAERGVFYLTIVAGTDSGKKIQLQGDVVSLGGGKELEISDERVSFADSTMAGEHAVLLWQKRDNTYMVSNRSPISPITVNGNVCGHALLIPGMKISIGQTTLEVSAEGYEGPTDVNVAPATVRPANDLYLGEPPAENKAPSATPVWLLNGDSGVSTAGSNKAWDALAETPTTPERKPAFIIDNGPAPVRPAFAPFTLAKDEDAKPAETAAPEAAPEAAAPAEPERKLLGRIVVTKGANKGKEMDIYTDISIGRSPDCSFTLTDAEVSRQHCTITFKDGSAFISNLSSSNTTKVDRSKVKNEMELPDSADITLAGRVVLKWTFEG